MEFEDKEKAENEEYYYENEYEENAGPNVLVMSDAAKPIYCRWGDEEDFGTLCSLIQAIRGSIKDDESMMDGDLQFMDVDDGMRVAFLSIGSLTLVAISTGQYETEAYLRLQLEYVYAQIILTLTDHVQKVFQKNPNMDIRNMLGSTHHIMDGILNAAGPLGNSGPFLVAGVEMVCPVPYLLREEVSSILVDVCKDSGKDNMNTLFAFLLVGRKLLTLVQPRQSHLQLHTADVHLILNYVDCHQPGGVVLSNNELWFPICLPGLNSSGFVHAYATCLDRDTQLSIVLISQDNSTQQFESFRKVARNVREKAGLPPPLTDSQILNLSSNANENNKEFHNNPDNTLQLNKEFFQTQTEESIESDHNDESDADTTQSQSMSSISQSMTSDSRRASINTLIDRKDVTLGDLREILADTLNDEIQAQMFQDYCSIATAMHFVFRCDVSIRSSASAQTGRLTQCFSSPFTFPFTDALSKRQIWSMYQRLSLRLRLGSSAMESTLDALERQSAEMNTSAQNIQRDCPSQSLFATPPTVHGVSYILDGNELFIALNGKDFELYATLPATVPPKTGTMLCARLVRRIWADEGKLFLARPLTWRS